MELEQIILEGQDDSIAVDTDSDFSTVCISDDTGVQEDICMQGEEADAFIAEALALYEEVQTLTMTQVENYLGAMYAENLWN